MSYLIHWVGTLALFFLALFAAIVLHEWGHYIAARLVGVRVLSVRIGLGQPYFTFGGRRDGAVWSFAPILIGGVTVLLDERNGPVPEEHQRRSFNRQAFWKRAIVIMGGACANILLPVLTLAWLLSQGIIDASPVIRNPIQGTLAARAHFAEGDRVQSVNGSRVYSWWNFEEALTAVRGTTRRADIIVETPEGQTKRLKVDLTNAPVDNIGRALGLARIRGDAAPIIGRVASGSAAEAAGLRPGDYVSAANGQPVGSWKELAEIVERNPGKRMPLEYRRDGQTVRTWFTPATSDHGSGVPMGTLGVYPMHQLSAPVAAYSDRDMPGLVALRGAALYSWGIAQTALENVRWWIWRDHSTTLPRAPVIAAEAISDAMTSGPLRALALVFALSICIGWFNLLPVPPLDGAQLIRAAREHFVAWRARRGAV